MATVLVVDDEQPVRDLVGLILRLAGHTVIAASNGVEGVALFRSTPDRFDLIITDIQMPVMNGHQLVKLARQTKAGAKIICMSGYADQPIPANVRFLQKPFAPDALLACVNSLLSQS